MMFDGTWSRKMNQSESPRKKSSRRSRPAGTAVDAAVGMAAFDAKGESNLEETMLIQKRACGHAILGAFKLRLSISGHKPPNEVEVLLLPPCYPQAAFAARLH